MEKTKKKVEEICELGEDLLKELRTHYNENCLNPDTCGGMVDMVKDLAEAEEKHWKACYYRYILEEMESRKTELRYGEPAGYDNRRYASGRYAPAGRGHISGYHDDYREGMEEYPYMDGSHGYTPNEMYGKAWHNYEMARKHYTESHSMEDKKAMDSHAMEHFDDVIDTTKTIWKHADPTIRKQMKTDLKALLADMPD